MLVVAAVQPCASERLNGDNRVRHSGLSYTFPFGVEKRDYELFDTTAQRAFPALFVGEEQIEGTTVYKFEQTVPETVTERREVPAQLAGGVEGTGDVPVERIYTNVRTVWVEPTTGQYIMVQERQNKALVAPDGRSVTILDAEFTYTDDTISKAAQTSTDNRRRLMLVTVAAPAVLAVLGLALLIFGLVVVARRPRAAEAGVPVERRGGARHAKEASDDRDGLSSGVG